jgi:GNAT superfamily N-acetyltransferase
MPDGPSFRSATRDDADAIGALHALSWQTAYRGLLPATLLGESLVPERVRHWRARLDAPGGDRRFVRLAESAAGLIGFACVLLDEDPASGPLVDNLHVHPGAKGRGVGRALFVAALEWSSRAAPGRPIHLYVIEGNQAARAFYDRLGGRIVWSGTREVAGVTGVPELRYEWPNPPNSAL